jgi:hypothetical protein
MIPGGGGDSHNTHRPLLTHGYHHDPHGQRVSGTDAAGLIGEHSTGDP